MMNILNLFHAMQIRQKLALLMLLCASLAICIGSISFLFLEYLHNREVVERDLAILTDINATNCAAPILFNDPRAANDMLATLRHHPQVISASVFTPDGTKFAAYRVQHSTTNETVHHPQHDGVIRTSNHIFICRPISIKGDNIGTISITYSLSEFWGQLFKFGTIILLLTFGIITLSIMLANYLGSLIASPILHLEETARKVASSNDYSLRAQTSGSDEIASLANQFNTMLGLIEERDQILEGKRIELAQELEQRTIELNASNDELLKHRKLESIGILAGGIAHDFNNFLMAIMSNVSLAMMQCTCKAEERLEAALKATKRASGLTKQLLTFSRGGSPVRGPVSLQKVVNEACTLALAGSSVKAVHNIPDNLPPVLADEGQLAQVVNNLLLNACQAMPDGGSITIAAWSITSGSCTSAGHDPSGNTVCLSVEDQGHGIHQEHIEKVFDPYFTTKKNGSGLGLATVYSIIRRHDGNITVRSVPNSGTSFIISLPAAERISEFLPSFPRHSSREQKKRQVLLMDDDEVIRDSVGGMLESLGCGIICAVDGEDMLRKYRQAMVSGSPFDLVLVDLTIPGGMGGEEAIRHLLELDPEATAYASSGYATTPVMADYSSYGFKGVLAKPYTMKELEEVILRNNQASATSGGAVAPS